jgi:hypothetical protein
MARIALRALVVLACVIAMNCGGSDTTNPTSPPPTGGGGGGGGTGGTGGSRGTAVYTDAEFDDNGWDTEVQTFGAGGSGGAGHLKYLGRVDGGYRQFTMDVNSAQGSGSAAQVAVFSFKRGTTYSARNDGEIFSVDYSEDSIMQTGSGSSHYGAPAFKQNGKLYTLVPGAGAFVTPETSWTTHSVTGRRASDFRTFASAADHPDFSPTGPPIDMGVMRLHTVPAGSPGGTFRSGVDNWRLTLNR